MHIFGNLILRQDFTWTLTVELQFVSYFSLQHSIYNILPGILPDVYILSMDIHKCINITIVQYILKLDKVQQNYLCDISVCEVYAYWMYYTSRYFNASEYADPAKFADKVGEYTNLPRPIVTMSLGKGPN